MESDGIYVQAWIYFRETERLAYLPLFMVVYLTLKSLYLKLEHLFIDISGQWISLEQGVMVDSLKIEWVVFI